MPLVQQMLDMAGVRAGDVLYDLGSGDGRIVIEAAKRGARAVGVEYTGWLVQRSWANADSVGVRDRVNFLHQDVFESDVSDANVVMLYLGPEFNIRLRPRLLEQLRPGARILSHGFHMAEWAADSTQTIGSGASRATLYLWIVPAVVDGFWSLEIDGLEPIALELRQQFQILTGRARGREAMPVTGQVEGATLRFELLLPEEGGVPLVLTGRLEEGRLSGVIDGPAGWNGRTWRGIRFSDPELAPR